MPDQPLSRQTEPGGGSVQDVPIRSVETELPKRLLTVIGDESRAGFARRCGLPESLVRKYLAGAMPSADRLVAIADAGGVTVEWLATGREPKLRRDLVAALRAAGSKPDQEEAPAVDLERLRIAVKAVEQGLDDAGLVMPPDKKAEVFVYAYELIGQMGATDQARQLLARLVKLTR